MTSSLLAGLWLAAAASGAEPALDFERQDPAGWARARLEEAGSPDTVIVEPAEPQQSPLRNPDGTVWTALAFPDAASADAVMRAVDEYLALGVEWRAASASRKWRIARRLHLPDRRRWDQEFKDGFGRIAAAALDWARPIAGTLPPSDAPVEERIAYYRSVQERILIPGLTPPFREFYAERMRGEGSVSDVLGWKGGEWTVTGPGHDNVVSVVYRSSQSAVDLQRVRVHEWVHVLDYARLGMVDDRGRQIRPLTSREAFFTEAKAYALVYLSDPLGEEYSDYLYRRLRDYYWVRPAGRFHLDVGELKVPEDFVGLPVRHFRTVAPLRRP